MSWRFEDDPSKDWHSFGEMIPAADQGQCTVLAMPYTTLCVEGHLIAAGEYHMMCTGQVGSSKVIARCLLHALRSVEINDLAE
jgi:hypothetical protein